jgi:succinate dehydrogenase hydrophobic anchor subunit
MQILSNLTRYFCRILCIADLVHRWTGMLYIVLQYGQRLQISDR